MTDIAKLTIAPSQLSCGGLKDRPLVLVDLAGDASPPTIYELPPCPVIGVGDPTHPLAGALDAVIEPPITANALAMQVLAHPSAAAVVVQLLRLLPAFSNESALVVESLAYAVLQGGEAHRRWLAATRRPKKGDEGEVLLERAGDHLTITLDRPQSDNAIDRSMRDALCEAFELAVLDREITGVSLRATGRSFSLGAELGEFGTTTDPVAAHLIRTRTLPAHMIARCADRLDVHVQGACVGAGLEMAAWGARVTANSSAWFHLPELSMDILPGAGGCVSLTRRIGRQRTALLVLSGKRINARTALAWGLIDAIVDEPA